MTDTADTTVNPGEALAELRRGKRIYKAFEHAESVLVALQAVQQMEADARRRAADVTAESEQAAQRIANAQAEAVHIVAEAKAQADAIHATAEVGVGS